MKSYSSKDLLVKEDTTQSIDSLRTYDLRDASVKKTTTDVERIAEEMEEESRKTNRIYALIGLGIVVFLVMLLLPTILSKNNTDKIYFTDIDNSMTYTIGPNSKISFPCSDKNKNIQIKYTLFDKTANAYCYDHVLNAGETSDWCPGEYISDEDVEHEIVITQTAYAASDTMYKKELDKKETTIKVMITENSEKETGNASKK